MPRSSVGCVCVLFLVFTGTGCGHGNFHELVTDLNARVEAAPEQAQLRLDRAQIFLEHEDLALAKEDLQVADSLGGHTEMVLLLQAKWHRLSKQWTEARQAIDSCLRLGAKNVPAHWERLEILLGQQETALALQEADGLLEMAGTHTPELVLQRVQLAEQLDPADALQWLDAWLAKHPRLAVLEQAALGLEMKLKRHAAVLARFDRLLAAVPRKEFLLLKKAHYLADQKEAASARESLVSCKLAVDRLPVHLRSLPAAREVTSKADALLESLSNPPPILPVPP
jgi:hypothetical protein